MHRSTSIIFKTLVGISVLATVYGKAYSQFEYISWDKSKNVHSSKEMLPERTIKEDQDGALLITYTFPGYTLAKVTDKDQPAQLIQITGFGYNLQTGAPSVPFRTEMLALPVNSEAVIKVISSDYVEVDGIYLPPAQEMQGDGNKIRPEYFIDKALYATSAFFPSEIATIADIQIMRGVPLAFIDVKPVQYNPVTKKARIYRSFTVKVNFKPSANKSDYTAKSARVNQILRNVTINSATVDKYYPAEKAGVTLDKTGYIIITTPLFKTAADTLAQWKRQLGYRVEVLSQATWTVAQVKTAVQERYQNWTPKPDYLLILGDQEDVPDYDYWNVYLTPNLHIYSENYYVCMDGASDYVPDMAHGRISIKSGEQALSVIRKIIRYEKNPPANNEFYNRGLHAAFFEDSLPRDNTDDKRYAHTCIEARDYMQSLGYQCDRVYYAKPNVNPLHYNSYFSGDAVFPTELLRSNGFAWDGDREDIINSINDGRFYIFHRDHGLNYGWVNPSFDTTDLNRLHNGDQTPVVFSVNCGSGMFQLPRPAECFAEKFTRIENGGAVGVISATEETRSGFNDALTIGFLDAIWPGYIPDFYVGADPAGTPHDPIYNMGDVLIQGLLRMTQTWKEDWANKDHYHLYHYFGDPAMRIWTHAPAAITAQHVSMLNIGATSITVTSSCPDGMATLVYNNDLKVKVQLVNGTATLIFPAALDNSVSEMILTISKHNFRPYTAKIIVTSGPLTDFTANHTNICPLGEVRFTDLSTSNPLNWSWTINPATVTFINSTNSNSRNPIVTFNAPGNYTIGLTASNTYGATTLVKNNFITVMNTPAMPIVPGYTLCDEGSSVLIASGSTGNYNWWTLPVGGSVLGSSSSYTTPVINQTTSYYVEGLKDQVNGSLTTTFASTNGAAGAMFDIRPKTAFTIDSFAVNVLDMLPHTVEVYYKNGSYIGYENNASAWTLLGTYQITGKGQDVAAILRAGGLSLVANQTYGIYITLTSGSLRYTNITQSYNNTDLSILNGAGIGYPFGSIYSPRAWNGTVFYSKGQYRCNSLMKEVQVIVQPIPEVPPSEDLKKCADEEIPGFHITGPGVKWYSDAERTNLIESGNNYTPASINTGVNTYYVTRSNDICESDAVAVYLTAFDATLPPIAMDKSNCENYSAYVSAAGELISWYSDPQGNNLILRNDTLFLPIQEAGEYIYYASNTQNGCESEIKAVNLLNMAQPEMPIAEDLQVCAGSAITLRANGENIKWYANDPKYFVIGTGNDLFVNQSVAGDYLYYVTQTVNCESEQDSVILHINAIPELNLGNDTSIFIDESLVISYSGEGAYLWSDGGNENSLTFIGDDFGMGNHAIWLEFVDVNNCRATDTIVINVNDRVDVPIHGEKYYLMIYPNPTHGILNVEFPQAIGESAQIRIADTQGRIISGYEFPSTYDSLIHEIDLSGFRKGIYFMTIYYTGLPQTVKIMVK
jgi:PKD repeat protein